MTVRLDCDVPIRFHKLHERRWVGRIEEAGDVHLSELRIADTKSSRVVAGELGRCFGQRRLVEHEAPLGPRRHLLRIVQHRGFDTRVRDDDGLLAAGEIVVLVLFPAFHAHAAFEHCDDGACTLRVQVECRADGNDLSGACNHAEGAGGLFRNLENRFAAEQLDPTLGG